MNEVRYNNIIYNNSGLDTVSKDILQKGLERKTFGEIRAEDMCIQNAVELVGVVDTLSGNQDTGRSDLNILLHLILRSTSSKRIKAVENNDKKNHAPNHSPITGAIAACSAGIGLILRRLKR